MPKFKLLEEEGDGLDIKSIASDKVLVTSLESLSRRIKREGIISRADILGIEELHTGIVTSELPIGMFTNDATSISVEHLDKHIDNLLVSIESLSPTNKPNQDNVLTGDVLKLTDKVLTKIRRLKSIWKYSTSPDIADSDLLQGIIKKDKTFITTSYNDGEPISEDYFNSSILRLVEYNKLSAVMKKLGSVDDLTRHTENMIRKLYDTMAVNNANTIPILITALKNNTLTFDKIAHTTVEAISFRDVITIMVNSNILEDLTVLEKEIIDLSNRSYHDVLYDKIRTDAYVINDIYNFEKLKTIHAILEDGISLELLTIIWSVIKPTN